MTLAEAVKDILNTGIPDDVEDESVAWLLVELTTKLDDEDDLDACYTAGCALYSKDGIQRAAPHGLRQLWSARRAVRR